MIPGRVAVSPSRVLVLGGTGFVGRSLVARLSADGAGPRVVVPSRRPARAKALAMLPGVELLAADVHDEATLVRLLAGCDAVVNLVAVLHGHATRFQQVHVELPRKLARACHAAGVRRLLHVSALGVPAQAEQAPSHYLASKARGEAVLHAAAAEFGLDVTVLRPSVIFGADDRFINLFAALQAWSPFVPLAGADARFQPVWVEDVAAALLRCLHDRSTFDQTCECAGPDVYRLRDLVALAGQWSGHARPIIALPMALGRVQAALLSLLPGEPLMSADNLASMRTPNVASGTLPGLAQLGIHPAGLASVMPAVLAQGPAEMDRWRRAAGR
ncbi:MAG: complex I NDUFA9 subunit family protein [Burkholderiales bacterium]